MTYILGQNQTTRAHSIGNGGEPYYSRGPLGNSGGYQASANFVAQNICVNISDWNAVTGLKVNFCNTAGSSLAIVTFAPADGTGLLTKALAAAYTGSASVGFYLEMITTGGTGYVESYDSSSTFECNSAIGSTYATPGNIHPNTDTENTNASPFVYLDGTIGGDTTAPTLTSPSAVANGSTGGTGTVTTNEGNGTLYGVVTTSSTAPTALQVRNGQNHLGAAATWGGTLAISSTGSKQLNASGLTTNVAHYFHFMHEDAAGNRSTVASSGSFVPTGSAVVASVSGDNIVLLGETGIQAAGQYFGDTTGTLAIIAGGVTQAQTPSAWRSSTAVFSFTQGNLPYGSATFQLITN